MIVKLNIVKLVIIMKNQLDTLQQTVLKMVSEASCVQELTDIKSRFFGKKGEITQLLKHLAALDPTERPKVGQMVNAVKDMCFNELNIKRQQLERDEARKQLMREGVDTSLPSRWLGRGSEHPIRLTMDWITDYFGRFGYQIESGPEIETDYYNFEALNIPASHPARDMHDTFYLKDGRLLRTHTSPVQIHVMEHMNPPIKIMVPGRVFRCDADASHSPVFHQMEGLCVAKGVTFAHLKSTLEGFLRAMFGSERKVRFRPSYFPFTEPSVEVDVEWKTRDDGSIEWMEVLGAGMVHPNVLRNVGIDDAAFTGFAFGLGIERMAMLRYHIPDIRLFYENDQRFLSQF